MIHRDWYVSDLLGRYSSYRIILCFMIGVTDMFDVCICLYMMVCAHGYLLVVGLRRSCFVLKANIHCERSGEIVGPHGGPVMPKARDRFRQTVGPVGQSSQADGLVYMAID